MNKQIHNNKQTNCKQTSKEVIIKEITKKKKNTNSPQQYPDRQKL